MKLPIRYVLMFLMTLVFVSMAQSDITLRGKITDNEEHEPISNAIIYVEDSGIYVFSNHDGIFEIPHLKPVKYAIKIHKLGYQNWEGEVTAKESSKLDLQVNLIPQPLQAEEILVVGSPQNTIPQSDIHEDKIRQKSPKDIGEFFKNVSGFSAIRKGAYATDPVMRGFKYDQLNVQYDGGIKISPACPNRMDPITTHVQAEDLEKIEIIKGPYSVRFGQVMGGVVNLVMKRPQPVDSFQVRSQMESGFESNGDGWRGRLGLTANSSFYNLYFSGATKDYGSYKNGSDLEIPSGFRVNDYSAKLGLTPFQNHYFQLSLRQSFARDVLHAGLPMDTDEDNTTIWSVDYAARNLSSGIFSFTAKIYGTDVDHIMANSRRPNFNMVQSVTDVSSQSWGGKLEMGISVIRNSLLYTGTDFYRIEKSGSRDRLVFMNACTGMMMNPPQQFTDAVWQNSDLTDAGIFMEWRQLIRPGLSILSGARVDFVSSTIGDPSPQFTNEYGMIDDKKEINLNATVSLNYDPNPTTTFQAAIGRGTRSANITERYINHLTIGQDPYEYFGNPNLKPEINSQMEISLEKRIDSFQIKGNVFYSIIKNYVTAAVNPDMPRLFMPCMMPQHTRQFQNIDRAAQTGFEFLMNGPLPWHFDFSSSVAYTWAKNHDWDEPLPEIPPLEVKFSLRYSHPSQPFWTELSSRFVAEQSRISESFRETRTSGFSVYDIQASYKPFSSAEFVVGIQNIFNKTYYEHLNRRFQNQPINRVVYEPGRNVTFQIKLAY